MCVKALLTFVRNTRSRYAHQKSMKSIANAYKHHQEAIWPELPPEGDFRYTLCTANQATDGKKERWSKTESHPNQLLMSSIGWK
jgi:hypothetical protein